MPPTLWYYEHEGKSGGPVTVSQLRQLASTGQLLATDKVRKDDMTKWVKARAVKGLFAPVAGEGGDLLTAPSSVEGDIETGASVFDFFGSGGGAPPPAEHKDDNTVFDFFNPNPAAAPSPTATPPAAPPPAKPKPKSAPPAPPPRKSFPPPPATPVESPSAEVPLGDLPPPGVTPSGVPLAAEVVDDDDGPMPLAGAAGDILDPVEVVPDVGSVSGPAVDLLPDDCVALTGGRTALRLAGRWLMAKTTGTDGPERLACLRLSKLEAAVLGGRAEAGPKGTRRGTHLVLSFHTASQSVAVACADGDKTCRAFLERVLAQRG